MSKQINPLSYQLVKEARKRGLSKSQALIAGKYSEATANHHSHRMSVIKCVDREIEEEYRARDITVDLVIRNLTTVRQLALTKQDYATVVKIDELLGKYIAMFTDKSQVSADIRTQAEQSILDKYIHAKRIDTQ